MSTSARLPPDSSRSRRSANRTPGTGISSVRRFMACGLVVAAASSSLGAQELASSFEQLSVLVKPRDTVTVTDHTGSQTKGTIAVLSPSSLELIVSGSRRSFLENETRTIRMRRSDSLRNGALWGLGVGAALGLTTFIDTEESPALPTGEAIGATFTFAGLGAAVGVGLDAMFRHDEIIYSRPSGVAVRVTASPWSTRGGAGARLVFAF
jgi:hypothetical protein